jgi:hypothetical protein
LLSGTYRSLQWPLLQTGSAANTAHPVLPFSFVVPIVTAQKKSKSGQNNPENRRSNLYGTLPNFLDFRN